MNDTVSLRTPGSEAERGAWRTAWLLVLAGVLVRSGLAHVVPPFPDETYYWEWSRRLAAGYFDHPPGIAVLVRAGTVLAGDTALGIRLGALLAGGVASGAVVVLAGRLGGGSAALRAALAVSAMPLAAAGLVLATPDAPVLLAAAVTLLAVDRALSAEPGTREERSWWCVAGVALGLGLVSKLTSLAVALGLAVGMVARPDLRRRLARAGPWLGGFVALGLFLPVLLWNARHGWVTFAFQMQHGLGRAPGSGLVRAAELVTGQAGLVSPILFGLLALASVRALRDPDPRRFLLGACAVVVFCVFAVSALRGTFEQNWPAPAYVPALVVLATARQSRTWKMWFRRGIVLGAVLVGAMYAHSVFPWIPVPPAADPVARAHGWSEVARTLGRHRAALERAGCSHAWLEARTYQHASEVAFHTPGNPYVHANNVASRANQYDLWEGFADLAAPGDCLVLFGIEPGSGEAVSRLAPTFDRVLELPPIVRSRSGRPIQQVRVWALSGWTGDDAPFR